MAFVSGQMPWNGRTPTLGCGVSPPPPIVGVRSVDSTDEAPMATPAMWPAAGTTDSVAFSTRCLRAGLIVRRSRPGATSTSRTSSNSSWRTLVSSMSRIPVQLLTKTVHPARDRRLHRSDGDPERVGRVRLAQVLVIPKDDRGPLLGSKRHQRPAHPVALAQVGSGRCRLRPLRREPRSFDLPPPELRPRQVHDRAAQVPPERVRIAKVAEPPEQLHERVLHQVLGERAFTRQEERQAGRLRRVDKEELLESPAVAPFGSRTFGSHDHLTRQDAQGPPKVPPARRSAYQRPRRRSAS